MQFVLLAEIDEQTYIPVSFGETYQECQMWLNQHLKWFPSNYVFLIAEVVHDPEQRELNAAWRAAPESEPVVKPKNIP